MLGSVIALYVLVAFVAVGNLSPDAISADRDYALAAAAKPFLGSAGSAAIFPWRRPDIDNASPIARYKVAGIPLITFAATLFTAILAFALYKWFQDDVYYVNLRNSEYYMAVLYGAAIAIYVGSKLYRRSQGMDLKMVYGEIPAE